MLDNILLILSSGLLLYLVLNPIFLSIRKLNKILIQSGDRFERKERKALKEIKQMEERKRLNEANVLLSNVNYGEAKSDV